VISENSKKRKKSQRELEIGLMKIAYEHQARISSMNAPRKKFGGDNKKCIAGITDVRP